MEKKTRKSYPAMYDKHTSYSYYRKKMGGKITSKKYNQIYKKFMEYIGDTLIEKGNVILPAFFGRLKIEGKRNVLRKDDKGRVKGLSTNWKATYELWKNDPEAKAKKELVFLLNEHTDGYSYTFKWDRYRSRGRFKICFNFIACTRLKRKLHYAILNGKEYNIIDYGKKT